MSILQICNKLDDIFIQGNYIAWHNNDKKMIYSNSNYKGLDFLHAVLYQDKMYKEAWRHNYIFKEFYLAYQFGYHKLTFDLEKNIITSIKKNYDFVSKKTFIVLFPYQMPRDDADHLEEQYYDDLQAREEENKIILDNKTRLYYENLDPPSFNEWVNDLEIETTIDIDIVIGNWNGWVAVKNENKLDYIFNLLTGELLGNCVGYLFNNSAGILPD